MFPQGTELLTLSIFAITQIVVIALAFQSLRERVKVLEEKAAKAWDNHELIIRLDTKINLLYEQILESKRQKSQ